MHFLMKIKGKIITEATFYVITFYGIMKEISEKQWFSSEQKRGKNRYN